jgi:hypothetical protein
MQTSARNTARDRAKSFTGSDLDALSARIVSRVQRASARLVPKRVQPLLPRTCSLGTGQLTLALSRLRCQEALGPCPSEPGGLLITGVAFADDLVPHGIGPFEVAVAGTTDASLAFEPPAELASVPVAPGFAATISVFTVATEAGDETTAGKVTAILELATRLLQTEARRGDRQLATRDVLTALAHVYAQTASIACSGRRGSHVLIPDTARITLPRLPEPPQPGQVGGTCAVAWQSSGAERFAEYRAEMLWTLR